MLEIIGILSLTLLSLLLTAASIAVSFYFYAFEETKSKVPLVFWFLTLSLWGSFGYLLLNKFGG